MYYDYANSSEASIKILRTILNLLLKHSIDQQNRRRTWFFLDEASLLPETCIADAMSLGRDRIQTFYVPAIGTVDDQAL